MSVTLKSAGGGGVTLDVPSTASNFALTVPASTTTMVGTDTTQTLTNKTIGTGSTLGTSLLVQGTVQATTSGTSKDFTGIPSWAKRITVMFSGVSTSGTSNIIVQLGTGGTPTYTTTGYVGTNQSGNGGVTTTAMTTGFLVATSVDAAGTQQGSVILTNLTSNTWTEMSILAKPEATAAFNFSAGSLVLGAVLTAIRITTVNGTDTFDAGSINILYE